MNDRLVEALNNLDKEIIKLKETSDRLVRNAHIQFSEMLSMIAAKKELYLLIEPPCEKCGEVAQPDTNPPLCTDCMASKGGGNDKETETKEE